MANTDFIRFLRDKTDISQINDHLNTFIDNLSIPALIVDRVGKALKLNKKAYEVFKIANKNGTTDICRDVIHCYHAINNFEMKGRMEHCKNCVFPKLYDDVFFHNKPYVKEKGTFDLLIDNVRTDMDLIISLTRMNDDEPKYALMTFEEFTELKKAREELTYSRELLELFFKESGEGFFFMMLDEPVTWNESADKEEVLDYVFAHQRITKVNKAMVEQYKAKPDDFLGLTPNDFFEHDVKHGKKVWRKFFDEGKLHIDTTEKRFDGTDMIVTGDYTCLYDPEGRITGHFGVQRDVTRQRLYERALQESEEKYRNLIETIHEGVWQIDENNITTFVNPKMAEMLGYSIDEMIGVHLFEFMDDKGIDLAKRNIEDRKKGISAQHDFEFIRKDGKKLYVLIQAVPIIHKGVYEGALATVMDITKRKQDEKRLHQLVNELRNANNTKDKFFGIIAHDLRSPMGSIISLTQQYIYNFDESTIAEQKDIIQNISETSVQLFKLLENLLEWSRINRGKVDFMPIDLTLKDFGDEAISLLSSGAMEKNIEVINNIDSNILVNVDNNLTQVIFRNLISNAIKFTYPDGRIVLDAHTHNGFAEVKVSDTGMGIEEKDIEKIFKVDQKISKKGTHGEKGTGLGLILCKEFVEMHGGRIWVESTPGKGSDFIFTLPLAKS